MITGNEELLIVEMQCLRISMEAKRRVQKQMTQEEKDKISMCIDCLKEMEEYYEKNR